MIGAGVGLLGKLIGSKKKNEEVVNRVDYKRMVADAEAAGFNPLTALRNGGAAGFSVTSQPVLSSTHAAIGDAIGGIGNFIANFDPFEDKMREVQYRTMQAQLDNLQADTGLKRKAMFDVPAVSGRRQMTAGPTLGQKQLPVASWFEPPGSVKSDALPIWVPGVDRDGQQMWIPNPDGPDIEQLGAAVLMRSQSGWERAAGTAVGLVTEPSRYVKSRRLTDAERRAQEDSWLPSWVPRFKFK